MSLSILQSRKSQVAGVALSIAVSLLVWLVARLPWNQKLQFSPLTLAILAGIAVGNSLGRAALQKLHPGLRVSQQTVLRLGIILYGVRLTLSDLARLGPRALALDVVVTGSVLIAGVWLGTRIFHLDGDTALLVSAGSGICGAAAVLATDRVIESEPHKVSVAVATVVVFGSIGMFLYPLLYPLTGFSEKQFGVYAGATVHEVAQVLAAGRAVSEAAGDTAVITKMLRVLLLAPVLLVVGRVRARRIEARAGAVSVPWFVFAFGGVIAAQSLVPLPARIRLPLIDLDTVLLASAMFALGVNTRWQQLKAAGTRPLFFAAAVFAGLVGGGWLLTRLFV